MSDEVLKQMESVDARIREYIKQKVEIEQYIQNLRNEKNDLKSLYNKKLAEEQVAWETWIEESFPWQKRIQEILENTFNLKQFRKQQLAAINATLSKKDTLLIMPTGGGKSLCYQLPAIVESGMTLVISPLISLMEDQIYKLKKLNIVVHKLTSGESADTKKAVADYLNKGIGPTIKLLYITPEMLAKSKKLVSGLQACHKAGNFNRIAIDEVHCCSEWGHDFRPDYRYLGLLRNLFEDVPVIGLTATATAFILNDVRDILSIPTSTIVRAPFDRPNLLYKVILKPSKFKDCLQIIANMVFSEFKNKSGIIYANSIKECEDITKGLREFGLKVQLYHAQLENEVRSKIYEKWMKNICQIVVATIAFGLGIDKSDVRFVFHFSVPKTVEDLYQQSGRAGRDGKPASCVILYKLGDYLKHSSFAKTKKELQRVSGILNYALNCKDCRHALIALHFEDETKIKCDTMCDNCLRKQKIEIYPLVRACKEIYDTIDDAKAKEVDLTLIKLVDAWYKKYKVSLPGDIAQHIIAHLLRKGYLSEDRSYTAYTVITYIKKSYVILPKCQINVEMVKNAALRKYLGEVILTEAEPKKRKLDDIDIEASTSQIIIE